MKRRRIAYLGATIALLAAARLLHTAFANRATPKAAPSVDSPGSLAGVVSVTRSATALASATLRVRRPPSSTAMFGVLTDVSETDLRSTVDREDLASRMGPAQCGDEKACGFVRSTLLDEHATTLEVVPVADWNAGHIDVDASTTNLSAAERASIPRRRSVVVVNVTTATSAQGLALRTAYATTAAVARRIAGLVHDPLLGRIETPDAFATHAVTTSPGDSTFRRDRIELLYEPKEQGVVRVLTAGLSRWGEPDVEAARVPISAAGRVGEIVLAVARAMADGPIPLPLVLSRDDIARATDEDDPVDAGLPAVAPIAVGLVSVHAEAGDPNDCMVRIVPPAGDAPMGYLDLAERFFGPLFTPPSGVMQKRRAEAQGQLVVALERWSSSRTAGAKLFVLLPFTIPGDAGVESMWVEVTGYDARTLTGKLIDEPLGATNVTQGSKVTRPRDDVEDLREQTNQR